MDELVYAIIRNIPHTYHSADLRNFFSEFVEAGNFDRFHFKHRPEIVESLSIENKTFKDLNKCCVVRLKSSKLKELIIKYSEKHWVNRNDESLPLKCIISKVKATNSSNFSFPSGDNMKFTGNKPISTERVQFSLDDLKSLQELNPPSIMPQGNVGTPTTYFLNLIKSCKMPSRLIGKLGLTFPKARGKRIYSSVPYNYGGLTVLSENIEMSETAFEAYSGSGKRLTDYYIPPANEKASQDEGESDDVEDDACEDWERHESLHENVTEQERTKERLYEEEIELKWEKGGSGLVFYTDAQHWDSLKGDFDERTADDWDVDMSIYYEKDSGDRDAQELAQMRLEKRRRKGCDESVFQVGNFEKHTKGIGRKVMRKHGWNDGQGLGKSVQGIANALENDGQHPKDKRGFGYHGEKLSKKPFKKPTRHLISTIYDRLPTVDDDSSN